MRTMIAQASSIVCLSFLTHIGCTEPTETRFRLSQAVDDPVVVSLSGSLATVQLVSIDGLPIEPREELLELLGTSLFLTVTDPSSGATADLLDGRRVEGTPASPGEYRVTLLEDMSAVMVVFYNRTTAGSSLVAGRRYDAAVSVSSNDYFVPESFTRRVKVQ